MNDAPANLEYAGFWRRLLGYLIDVLLIMVILWPLHAAFDDGGYASGAWGGGGGYVSGAWEDSPMDFWLSWVLPAVATILFWIYKSATPGKMAISAKICDARTGGKPSPGQCIGRYFAYIISAVPLGLGFIWIGFDRRKQGWHDKLAGTVVVRKSTGTKSVHFEQPTPTNATSTTEQS